MAGVMASACLATLRPGREARAVVVGAACGRVRHFRVARPAHCEVYLGSKHGRPPFENAFDD